jgi:sodium/hydrogen exchanger-like protein 6/7/sodium/hydrogen exchanger 8
VLISFAGNIRGAVAFALISTLSDDKNPFSVQVIQSTVLFIVILTTIGLGAVMP